MSRPQLISYTPQMTSPWYLGSLGHVADLEYSDTMPGGASQLTATLQADPGQRHEALDPGRRLRVYCGAGSVWDGILAEPVPGDSGWAVSADGAGTWGSRYRANWTSSFTATGIIDSAISRGLPWIRGSMTGAYLDEQKDTGSLSITEFMDLISSPVSKTWRVQQIFAGLEVSLLNIPSTVTRLLVSAVPAVRTLAGYINALYARYEVSADTGGADAVYALSTASTNDESIARHGRMEDYWDLTAAGVITGSAALSHAQSALAKYTAASWSGPFTVGPGQYLNSGGAPVDLACEHAGEVVQLIMADGPYGGEVVPSPPVTFPVGKVKYSDKDGTLEVTPLQAWNADFSNILSTLAPKAPA